MRKNGGRLGHVRSAAGRSEQSPERNAAGGVHGTPSLLFSKVTEEASE